MYINVCIYKIYIEYLHNIIKYLLKNEKKEKKYIHFIMFIYYILLYCFSLLYFIDYIISTKVIFE